MPPVYPFSRIGDSFVKVSQSTTRSPALITARRVAVLRIEASSACPPAHCHHQSDPRFSHRTGITVRQGPVPLRKVLPEVLTHLPRSSRRAWYVSSPSSMRTGATSTSASKPRPSRSRASPRTIAPASVYYEPVAVSESDLALMRKLDELHLEHPHAGSRMLRDLLAAAAIARGENRRPACQRR
jgi:hypothetical protein